MTWLAPNLAAPAFWQVVPPSAAARLLQPAGWVYGEITRRRMLRSGALLPAPVICIGNFTAGGAGKTPMALMVAQMLQRRGSRPFFLSRGFGGSRRGAAMRVDYARHTSRDTGDEPMLLAARAPVIVGADRFAAARLALQQGADVLVMDDGLQNPSLAKTFSVAMVDGVSGFGNGLCLPAGPMRAPAATQWTHVEAVIIVGGGSAGAAAGKAARAAGRPVFAGALEPDATVAALLQDRRVLAFAAIGRPAKFFGTLEQIGAKVVHARAFPDHHRYSAAEMRGLQMAAMAEGAMLVTTQKDMARTGPWDGPVQPVSLPVTLKLADHQRFADLLEAGLAAFESRSAKR